MRLRYPVATFLAMVLVLAITGACKKPPVTTPAPEAPPTEPARPAEPPAPKEVTETFKPAPVETAPIVEPTIDDLNRKGVLRTVYFAYDSAELGEETRRALQANAEWLKSNPRFKIRVEGHCDERGTVEYNLALGQRRADATRDYLGSLGVDARRLTTISYGEERPAAVGHDDSAWSQNRRAEFVIEG